MKISKPIRLYWGENYSEKPEVVKRAVNKAIENSIKSLNLYPGLLYQEVVDLISKSLKVKSNQIILGHGIEGLIHLTSLTFLGRNKSGGMFKPSFFVFENNLKRYKSIKYPCHYNRKVNVKDFTKKINKTDLFFLASPNTVTGNYLLNKEEIEQALKSYKGLFVVDECYYGIGKQTVVDLVKQYDNLIVYRGITKVMGIGSLRFAFAVSNKKIIDRLKYNLNDIELDPINTFSLNIFKETFPYFKELAKNTNKFFDKFLKYMKRNFPKDKFIKNLTTFHFMDIRNYKVPSYKVVNYMNKNGYIFSESMLKSNKEVTYPEFIQLTPPPEEYWKDFVETLKKALLQK